MGRNRRLKLYEFVRDLVEIGGATLVDELRLDPDRAREVMIRAARGICERNAKSTVYIPEAINLVNMERNALIWAAYQVPGPAPGYSRPFSPQRAAELATEYDLSRQALYGILADQRRAEMGTVQGDLGFDEDPAACAG